MLHKNAQDFLDMLYRSEITYVNVIQLELSEMHWKFRYSIFSEITSYTGKISYKFHHTQIV